MLAILLQNSASCNQSDLELQAVTSSGLELLDYQRELIWGVFCHAEGNTDKKRSKALHKVFEFLKNDPDFKTVFHNALLKV